MSHILILGGDGYLGWPTAMYFSARDYEVTVVDNYFRRHVCDEIDCSILYPVPNLVERARIRHEKTGHEIKVVIGDLKDAELMRSLFDGSVHYQWASNKAFTGIPNAIVHYAEQPSAPYSLMDYKTANFTLSNNLTVTNNLMFAVRDLAPDGQYTPHLYLHHHTLLHHEYHQQQARHPHGLQHHLLLLR